MTARQQAVVLDTVDRQLSTSPMQPTRNRKHLRPNPLAPWALRIGDLRVYYRVEAESRPRVVVVAVGTKDGNVVRIAGEEIQL